MMSRGQRAWSKEQRAEGMVKKMPLAIGSWLLT